MPSERLSLRVTPRQRAFIDASEREVLFGGAAGGGKSFGQLIDALLYALRYPKSKQLILRRTYPELEKSLIRVAGSIFPRSVYTYNGSTHTGRFRNGSLIDFGYSATESDVFQYQSAEYDVIRFDELTHFTEFQYVYMLSRLRGVNGYPKQIKASTNPGGIGHAWVKERFIDPSPPDRLLSSAGRARRRIAPVSPVANRARSTVFAMVPALAGTFLTVSVAFTTADGLTASAAISAAFRLLALLWTGFRGYGMGYRSVVRDGVSACKTRSALLLRFLSECGDESSAE